MLRSTLFRAVTSPVLIGAGALLGLALIGLNVGPMLSLLVVGTKEFVEAPSLNGAVTCAVSLYAAYLLCRCIYGAISGEEARPVSAADDGKRHP
jgi:hypothetical protein